MKYSFYPILLIRTPAKSYSDFDPNDLEAIILDEEFQFALSLSSPELFATLKKHDFRFSALNVKVQLAVYKYYNRMSFRPTPFGTFASVAMTKWCDKAQPLFRSEGTELMAFGNFYNTDRGDIDTSDTLLTANPTIYQVGNQLRFIARQKQGDKRASFPIKSIPRSEPLVEILKKTQMPLSLGEIEVIFTQSLFQKDPLILMNKLVAEQILIRKPGMRITGDFTPVNESQNYITEKIYSLGFHTQSGSLTDRYKTDLADGLFALEKLAPPNEDILLNFKRDFLRKFEMAEVPLLKALDPQLGVDYLKINRLSSGGQTNGILIDDRIDEDSNPSWTAVSALLMKKIMHASGKREASICLSENEISNLPAVGSAVLPPPSISVMFRITEEKRVLIEQAGGSSAINIAGRFSHHSGILEHLRSIASAEEDCNPDVVFAEIAAADHFQTDNINSRAHLRKYEIPILTESSLPADQVIGLNDLYIRVEGNRIVLRSERLKRVVIPRLGTAYNYRLSNSPVLQFLADLQHQDLRDNLNFRPEFYLPGLSFYPRITFKNAILSPAKWIWHHHEFAGFSDSKFGKQLFRDKALASGLSIYFALSTHDQQLVFDLECDQSIGYFLRIISGQDTIVLQECFLSPEDACVSNKNGGLYVAQFIAFLVNRQKCYMPPPLLTRKRINNLVFLPGHEWIYFKIYCHHKTIGNLLTDQLIVRLLKSKHISNWFFVHYWDPNHHLRLRIKCQSQYAQKIYAQVKRWIGNYIRTGLVSDFLIGSYQPELERYGFAGMKQVMLVFQRSSELLLDFHKLRNGSVEHTCLGFASVEKILSEFFPDFEDLMFFLNQTVQRMALDKAERIELDKYYRQHRQLMEFAVENLKSSPGMQKLKESCNDITGIKHGRRRKFYSTLVLDLVHMHVNRLNTLIEGDLEKKIYYWLVKHCSSVYYKSKSYINHS